MSLQAIQAKLRAPKNQHNNFGNYAYRSQEDILEALKPLLATFDYSIIISDKIVAVLSRVYVEATVTLYDDQMKAIAQNTAYAREPENRKGMDESQITGATSSYARKYALNGMFLIDDVKDADATNTGENGTITPEQAKEIKDLFDKAEGINEVAFYKFIGTKDIAKMPTSKYDETVKLLKQKIKPVREPGEEG